MDLNPNADLRLQGRQTKPLKVSRSVRQMYRFVSVHAQSNGINRGPEESRRRDYGRDDEGGGGSGIDGKGDAVATDRGEVEGGGVGMRLTESRWGAWSGTEAREKMVFGCGLKIKLGVFLTRVFGKSFK
ncbi:hypothetical protein C1H46_020084 [Malus baccata]|uniref:Uncharacterized protein n=1 Tax=Malus baccata TaxID=106549 RepID=A0A540M687_MALBA|nr:hypothetical protein C1H46_020084 [Malus baccata]